MRERFFLTTPIYYVNDAPHIGTAYCTLAADTIARYHRLRGEEVLFTTGTDENAPKNAQAALLAGQEPQPFVDAMAARFRGAWEQLEIGFDDFIRTTEPRHVRAAQHFFSVLRDRGDIYLGTYEGWYCQPDETYFAEDEVIRPEGAADPASCLCPECGRPLKRVSETNYFFALSRYGDRLRAEIEGRPGFLLPDFRRNEVLAFINAGLRDVCISRAASDWGIPVPGDPSQVIYVWFDALINYLTVAGYPDDAQRLERWWPADLHLVGKDIYVRFHCTLWPAMLLAAGLPLPRCVFGHGFWLNDGVKISKSLGNAIDFGVEVDVLAALAGCRPEIARDAVRYFLFRQAPFGQDADFSRPALVQRYNGDLANDLGNAVHRSLHLARQNCGGRVPAAVETNPSLRDLSSRTTAAIEAAMESLALQDALIAVSAFVTAINKFLDERAPWSLAKRGEQKALDDTLYAALEGCRLASTWLSPFLPAVSDAICRQLGIATAAGWSAGIQWGGLVSGADLPEPDPIFPRVDRKALAALLADAPGPPAAATGAPAPSPPPGEAVSTMIGIEDFARVELRVVEILHAERVPKADKLLQLRVSLGSEERTVLAGIAEYYDPGQLAGRRAILVANLAPRKVRGIESQGMLLAAEEGDTVSLLQPDRELPAGARVR